MNDPSAYARQIETYLCQKNKGHLIRVVGPSFALVSSWAEQGVPLKVAFRGIDRCCERRVRSGARPRPVRIEFCEADVLAAFDDWRRAVGVTAAASTGGDPAASRRPALAAHLERAIAKLAHVRGVGAARTDLQREIEGIIRTLEEMIPPAVKARGDARAQLISRLADLDAALMAAAIAALDPPRKAALRGEAGEELAAFGSRMPAEARQRAIESAFVRLVREGAGLPALRYE